MPQELNSENEQALPGHVASTVGLGAGAWTDAAPLYDIGRAALLVVSQECLAELLQLPAGCHIDGAMAPYDQPGVLHLRVRGAGWPVKSGMLLPRASGTLTRHFSADGTALQTTIDWALPTNEAPNVSLTSP